MSDASPEGPSTCTIESRSRPGVGEAAAGFEQVLQEHLHICEDGHEVRVTGPTGDDVQMDVIDDADAGDPPQVPAEVVALGCVGLGQSRHAALSQPVDLERLLVRKPGEVAEMPV